jgi:hypothetical protein
MRFDEAAAQVLALLAPYLRASDRALVERLRTDYRVGASDAGMRPRDVPKG